MALLILFLSLSTLSYAIAAVGFNVIVILRLLVWSVFVEFLLVGLIVSTISW